MYANAFILFVLQFAPLCYVNYIGCHFVGICMYICRLGEEFSIRLNTQSTRQFATFSCEWRITSTNLQNLF